ncbi:NAD(P)-dependent oxidoreductase [Roseibium algae]|uniref:NAD(P)-dependent oxidoreductase n=1 Tax=Roseibium algae TaxID=3123038 RepID=A0ABU8THZ5_9HYPH
MNTTPPIIGVYLSPTLDLDAIYGETLRENAKDVILLHPDEVKAPEEVRFAICWLPDPQAFAPYPNLGLAMSIGAGVNDLLAHPYLKEDVAIARIRDPHQADLMAGFVAHEILNRERGFDDMMNNARTRQWLPLAMRAPAMVQVAVLGHGTMGRAVVRGLSALGFQVRVACRSEPNEPLSGVSYHTGSGSILSAADGADYLVNVLPLTVETENILNVGLFTQLNKGAWLIQIGRGEHLVEADLTTAINEGILSGATLDVFRQEPLPAEHPFWSEPKLRITPHIASDSLPETVSAQVIETARALRSGQPLDLAINRKRGY